MPIYEYQCQACGQEFERRVHSYNPKVMCPHCGGEDIEKMISRFGFKIEPKKDGTWVSGHEKK